MSVNANPFYFPVLNDPLIHDRWRVKENQMDLEVIAQLTVLTLMVVSGPLVIDRALDGSLIHPNIL